MLEEKQVPKLPDNFDDWADSNMTPASIYYQIKGTKATCRCGKCAAEFELKWTNQESYENTYKKWDKKPARYDPAKCKVCGHEGVYEWKRVKSLKTEHASFWLMQRTADNDLIVRIFRYLKYVRQGEEQELNRTEEERIILKIGAPAKYVYESRWGNGRWVDDWEERKTVTATYKYCEKRYPTWDDEIKKSNLRYFDPATLNPLGSSVWADTIYLISCCYNPGIEMYAKSGMRELVKWLASNYGKSQFVNRRKNKLEEQLKINRERLKDLIKLSGEMTTLRIFQMEKKYSYKFTTEEIEFMEKYHAALDRIEKTINYISLRQLMNRVDRYTRKKGKDKYGRDHEYITLLTYTDYLDMRHRLGYDMTNTVYLFPRNLKAAHDKMVKEQNERKDELHIERKTKEFPISPNLIKRLNAKYKFESEGYSIRPANSVKEIILEGRILHHCVGGDNYLRKHTKGITTICFLRTEPDTPYVTIEIEGDTIIQWYGAHDKKPDKEHIEEILKCWTAAVEEKDAKKKKSAIKIEQKNNLQEAIY